jgi:hypothetical protein
MSINQRILIPQTRIQVFYFRHLKVMKVKAFADDKGD